MDRPPEPGERLPPRRPALSQPPGDRYRSNAVQDGSVPRAGSASRGIALATVVGIGGAALMTFLAGAFAVSVGLLVIAALVGRFVALALRAGTGGGLRAGQTVAAAVGVTLAAVALAQLGIWLYARSEGGALAILDYLAETFGVLVPLQFVVAAAVAWWTARHASGASA